MTKRKAPKAPTRTEQVIAMVKAHLGVGHDEILTRELIRPLAYTPEFEAIVHRVYGNMMTRSMRNAWTALVHATPE